MAENTEVKISDLQIYMVKWQRRTDEYASGRTEAAKPFLSREDADAFVEKLKEAKALLQDTDNINIRVETYK